MDPGPDISTSGSEEPASVARRTTMSCPPMATKRARSSPGVVPAPTTRSTDIPWRTPGGSPGGLLGCRAPRHRGARAHTQLRIARACHRP
eukprot:570316-Prymnesium_polylepis.1